MSFRLDRVHVWSCEVPDKAGGVAGKLAELANAAPTSNTSARGGCRTSRDAASCSLPRSAGRTRFGRPNQSDCTKSPRRSLFASKATIRRGWPIGSPTNGAGRDQFSRADDVGGGQQSVGYAAFDDSEDANRAATILANVGSAKVEPPPVPAVRRVLAGAH